MGCPRPGNCIIPSIPAREGSMAPVPHPYLAFLLLAAVACSRAAAGEDAAPVLFGRDVMAVLSRGGCNQGVCHGNRNGKGGFKLSLRGQDPDLDFAALTREALGRRVDPIRPEESLVLRKPTLAAPHEGGRRFAAGSLEYEVLRRWIAAGCPEDPRDAPRLVALDVSARERVVVQPEETVRIEAFARFSDGSSIDVRRLAVYEASEPLVTVE